MELVHDDNEYGFLGESSGSCIYVSHVIFLNGSKSLNIGTGKFIVDNVTALQLTLNFVIIFAKKRITPSTSWQATPESYSPSPHASSQRPPKTPAPSS
jgi:hypothetical protein